MEIFTFEEGKLFKQDTGITIKDLFSSGTIGIQQVVLNTGGKLEKYTAQKEMLYYITEGEGTILIKAERKRVMKGMLIKCPAKALRAVMNSSSRDLSFLIITIN